MFDIASASNGVEFALLEGQLLGREVDRSTFVDRASDRRLCIRGSQGCPHGGCLRRQTR
jgi:hypothetical protein